MLFSVFEPLWRSRLAHGTYKTAAYELCRGREFEPRLSDPQILTFVSNQHLDIILNRGFIVHTFDENLSSYLLIQVILRSIVLYSYNLVFVLS